MGVRRVLECHPLALPDCLAPLVFSSLHDRHFSSFTTAEDPQRVFNTPVDMHDVLAPLIAMLQGSYSERLYGARDLVPLVGLKVCCVTGLAASRDVRPACWLASPVPG